MSTSWSFKPAGLSECGPTLLFKEKGPVVFTKDYVKHTLFSKKEYPQGTSGVIVRVHRGFFGKITDLDVRLPEGEFVREVPVDYFRAS